jgi:hypothetical protein
MRTLLLMMNFPLCKMRNLPLLLHLHPSKQSMAPRQLFLLLWSCLKKRSASHLEFCLLLLPSTYLGQQQANSNILLTQHLCIQIQPDSASTTPALPLLL